MLQHACLSGAVSLLAELVFYVAVLGALACTHFCAKTWFLLKVALHPYIAACVLAML